MVQYGKQFHTVAAGCQLSDINVPIRIAIEDGDVRHTFLVRTQVRYATTIYEFVLKMVSPINR